MLTQLLTMTTTHKFPSLHPVGNGLGADGREPVEADVQRVDVEVGLHVKVVADVVNLVGVDVQPVERGRQQEVVKLLDLKRKFMSCGHCQELGQLADLASDWLLFTLVQPIRSQLSR